MTKKILLINDIPGYGKVAISAMAPILIHRKYEVFCLPTMIVSNTFNYGSFASVDTTEYMKDALRTWDNLGFSFDAVSTGYIANDTQAEMILDLCRKQSAAGVTVFADPIMADNGKLYNSITQNRINIMKKIVSVADYIFPNITEACFLSGFSYDEKGFDRETLYNIATSLHKTGAKSVIITGATIINSEGIKSKAVIGYDHLNDKHFTVIYDEIPMRINGSGDTFSAVIMSEILAGTELETAVIKAVSFVRNLILNNSDIAAEYNGLPIESGLDLL